MNKAREAKITRRQPGSGDEIAAYAHAQLPALRAICGLLRELIDVTLPKADSKVWHGAPVWFIGENPVVGYDATAEVVKLLFWNGRAFGDPQLKPVGKYRAAHAVFSDCSEIDPVVIRRWLKNAASDVFDSQAYFKELRRGR